MTGPAQPLSSEGPEGITGTVTVYVGDFMPPAPQAPSVAASATVHVLRGQHAPMESLDRSASFYVGTTTTAADGTYRVALPPGTYTVLIEHEGRPYLNSFAVRGAWTTVTVAAGQWATFDIQDTANATF